MRPDELRAFRERQGMSQAKVAEILNGVLDRKYGSATVSAWENEKRPIPEAASVFLDELALAQALPPPNGGQPDNAPPAAGAGPVAADLPPGDDGLHVSLLAGGGTAYARVCEDLWQTIAVGVTLTGSVIGNKAVERDGQIIEAQKKELGRAYGHLAETNETFRNMLKGMTTSSAWLEVSLVTGQTVGLMLKNHAEVNGSRSLHSVPSDTVAFPDAPPAA